MKSHKRILVAFLLNLFFSALEFIGGIFTGSFAILSDSLHDMGDAASIGISFFLEKKSTKKPDDNYTYGYLRYSVIGSVIMTIILITGSVAIIYNAVLRIINPCTINYNGMLILAVIGASVNFVAALVTREGKSLNQKAVNLHMLEDVLGWIVVLVGAVIMKFTGFTLIDPILSIAVALFVLINAIKNLSEALSLFLEKTPKGMSVEHIREEILKNKNILDVHHIHLWSMDGVNNLATMHIVTEGNPPLIKAEIRKILNTHNISHVTLEIEAPFEECKEKNCTACEHFHSCSHHHHHHHH